MRWNYFPLSDNDPKALEQILENLSVGAHEHTLARKLLARFSNAVGPILLIAYEWLDPARMCCTSMAPTVAELGRGARLRFYHMDGFSEVGTHPIRR